MCELSTEVDIQLQSNSYYCLAILAQPSLTQWTHTVQNTIPLPDNQYKYCEHFIYIYEVCKPLNILIFKHIQSMQKMI